MYAESMSRILIKILLVGVLCMNAVASADFNPAPTSVGLYNFSVYSVQSTTGIVILPRNIYRAGLTIQNNGSVAVVIKPGSTPTSATDGIVLAAGALMQFTPTIVDAIYGKSTSYAANLVMIEYLK